jgi:protease I
MNATLQGRRIAILATDGVEQVELTAPLEALKVAGAEPRVISIAKGSIQAMQQDVTPAAKIEVDFDLSVDPAEFDALVLPGGTTNPDKLRMDPKAVAFVRHFLEKDKPIAAICHGPWMLIEANGVEGKTLTSWPSLKTDIENAGGDWVDEPLVRDRNLITSRKPDDLVAFCTAMVKLFAEA